MKLIFFHSVLILFFLFFYSGNKAQNNIVINGDFENYKKEKFPGSQVFAASDSQLVIMSLRERGIVYFVPGWTIPGVSTPDFFESDSCRGKACAGIFTTHKDQYREFLQFSLREPLHRDSLYTVSFYLRPFNKAVTVSHFIDPISLGFLFDEEKRGKEDLRFPVLNKPAHFVPLPELSSNDWTRIEFNYLAKGGEKFISIGNFLHDDQIPGLLDTLPDKRTGYIVLDDFSVEPQFFYRKNTASEFLKIYYEKDQSELSVESGKWLEEKLESMYRNCKNYTIKIKAYSSEEGNTSYNYNLSAMRAGKIKEYLIGQGVPESAIKTEYFGEKNCEEDCRKAEVWFTCR